MEGETMGQGEDTDITDDRCIICEPPDDPAAFFRINTRTRTIQGPRNFVTCTNHDNYEVQAKLKELQELASNSLGYGVSADLAKGRRPILVPRAA